MAWYFKISHPYIIPISEGYSVRPAEPDVAVQEDSLICFRHSTNCVAA
ncbi:hypothetical protein A2U01_0118043, partial [Trifolium medium]|nr:hypothetical protein [Trifolium medium]